LKDECGICHRVLSLTYMRKCQRCHRVFCRDCMVADVATGDPTALLCLNCAKRVVSPRVVDKYAGLGSHLKFRAAFTGLVNLSFARIDGLIGSNLPMAAFRDNAWWGNSLNAHSKAWLEAGWEVQEVNLKDGYVIFKKVRNLPPSRKKRKKEDYSKPFTPVPVHIPKSKIPSKTKVSKLYARIKNLERQRSASNRNIRGLSGSSPYSKRLFKPDKKPQ
jgi:hypothetical protein